MNIVRSLTHAPIGFKNLTEIGGDLGLSRCSRQPQAPVGIPLLSDRSVYWLYGYGGLRAGNQDSSPVPDLLLSFVLWHPRPVR